MADYLSDNSETTAQLETLYSVTDVPDREPTNDGPDDNGFAGGCHLVMLNFR